MADGWLLPSLCANHLTDRVTHLLRGALWQFHGSFVHREHGTYANIISILPSVGEHTCCFQHFFLLCFLFNFIFMWSLRNRHSLFSIISKRVTNILFTASQAVALLWYRFLLYHVHCCSIYSNDKQHSVYMCCLYFMFMLHALLISSGLSKANNIVLSSFEAVRNVCDVRNKWKSA